MKGMASAAFPLVMGILQNGSYEVGTDLHAMHFEVVVFPNKRRIIETFQITGENLK